jgi:hypothetical protein
MDFEAKTRAVLDEHRERERQEAMIARAVTQGIVDARPADDVLDNLRQQFWLLRCERAQQTRYIILLLGLLNGLVAGLLVRLFWA